MYFLRMYSFLEQDQRLIDFSLYGEFDTRVFNEAIFDYKWSLYLFQQIMQRLLVFWSCSTFPESMTFYK